jgi:hypothetical protein
MAGESGKNGEGLPMKETFDLAAVYEQAAQQTISTYLTDNIVGQSLAIATGNNWDYATVCINHGAKLPNYGLNIARSKAFEDFSDALMQKFPAIKAIEQKDERGPLVVLWLKEPTLLRRIIRRMTPELC